MSTKNDKHLSIGDRLRQERKRIGLTQAELSAATGIHARTQANYELNRGKSGPGIGYFEALRKTGIDVTYVTTGVKSLPGDGLKMAAERLLMAFGEILQVPFETVQDAISRAADMPSHEVHRQAQRLFDGSPVLVAKNTILKLDRDVLVDIIEGVERALLSAERSATPLRKAHTIARLYEMFSTKGEIDLEILEAAVRVMPTTPA